MFYQPVIPHSIYYRSSNSWETPTSIGQTPRKDRSVFFWPLAFTTYGVRTTTNDWTEWESHWSIKSLAYLEQTVCQVVLILIFTRRCPPFVPAFSPPPFEGWQVSDFTSSHFRPHLPHLAFLFRSFFISIPIFMTFTTRESPCVTGLLAQSPPEKTETSSLRVVRFNGQFIVHPSSQELTNGSQISCTQEPDKKTTFSPGFLLDDKTRAPYVLGLRNGPWPKIAGGGVKRHSCLRDSSQCKSLS